MKRNFKRIVSMMLAVACIGTMTLFNNTKVNAATQQGSITLDTRSYQMAPNNIYDIGVKIVNGDSISTTVSSSQVGVASVRKLPNGNYRITGISIGTTYIICNAYDEDGNLLTHASIKVTVARGVKQGGAACRATSIFTIKKSQQSDTVGTRQTPAKMNQPIVFDGTGSIFDQYKVEVTLTEIDRGSTALQMALDANEFNDIPPAGKEYLFAKFKIRAISSKNDESVDINKYEFDLYSSSGVEYDDFVSVAGIKDFSPMYSGGTTEGYACYYVDKSDTNPSIVFLKRDNGGIWFDASQTSINNNQPSPTTTPTQTVNAPTTVSELETYLNQNFSSLVTPMGTMRLTNNVIENPTNQLPFDYWIQTSWEITSVDTDIPFNIAYSNKYTDAQKEATKEILRQTQRNIYNKVHEFFPTKKLDGGFYNGFYKYPATHEGFESIQFLSWYNYTPELGTYNEATMAGFNWHTYGNDYHFE